MIRRYVCLTVIGIGIGGAMAVPATVLDGFAETHMAEDATVEMMGALTFLTAALVAAFAFLRGRGLMAGAITVLSAIAFLDEMSFGERHLDLTAPRVAGTKIDGFHDFLALSWRLVGDAKTYLAIAVSLALLAAWAGIVMLRKSERLQRAIWDPAFPALAAAATMIALAQFFDYGFGKRVVAVAFGRDALALLQRSHLEEALEFAAALFMLVAALHLVGWLKILDSVAVGRKH